MLILLSADSYPANYCTTHLITRLPTHNSTLLSTLLSLFSSVAAYSAVNGMTPRKIASLFSPYIFGLADDQPFEETYREWQRSTDATEHIILSYVSRTPQALSQTLTLLLPDPRSEGNEWTNSNSPRALHR